MTPVMDLTKSLMQTERLNCPVRIAGEPGFEIEQIREGLTAIDRGIAGIGHDMAELERNYRIQRMWLTQARAMADDAREAKKSQLEKAIRKANAEVAKREILKKLEDV